MGQRNPGERVVLDRPQHFTVFDRAAVTITGDMHSVNKANFAILH